MQICKICKIWYILRREDWHSEDIFLSYPTRGSNARELNSSLPTIIDWSNYCRQVCMNWIGNNQTKLGGIGKIVKIDEAKFGRRKYNLGRVVGGQWVFGGIGRGSRRIFLVSVPNRTARILVDLIKKWKEPGTTIMSDCWRAYNSLEEEGFQHPTVNNSYNFVDPDSGANTQSVERMWRDVCDNTFWAIFRSIFLNETIDLVNGLRNFSPPRIICTTREVIDISIF